MATRSAGAGPMNAAAVARRHEISRAYARYAAAAAAALGTSVLAGWYLDDAHLKAVLPGFVAMNPVTAVAFILAGLALWWLRDERARPARAPAQVCAALVLGLALLCLSRVYGPWDLGPDRLVFRQRLLTELGGMPNRMAPNTAMAFVLLGGALLLLDSRPRRSWHPADVLAAGAGAVALGAAVGYAYNVSLLYGVGAYIPMAVNTAIGFLVLAAGVLCARPDRGLVGVALAAGPGGVLARRLLPAAIVIPLGLGWLQLRGYEAGMYDVVSGTAVLAAATTLVIAVLIWQSAARLTRSDLARRQAEESARALNEQLEARVDRRTRELHAATAELRALFEASPLAICSVTAAGAVRSWNPAAEQLFGWTAAEVVGRQLPNVPPDRLEEFRALREQVLAGHPFTNFETQRIRKDGRLVDVSVSTAALHDAAGVAQGVVAVYADVGMRKTLEAQLQQAQKMEAIGRLAGGIAHDFNNLLTVIRTAAEILAEDLAPGDARRREAEDIREAAARAAALTRQLLAFSRRQVLKPRAVDANGVISGLEPMIRRLVEENVNVVTRLAPDLDRIKVDPGQLEQVLLNLVVNARDAMPDGGTLLIETANIALDEEYPQAHLTARAGPHVVVAVTDTGCGMDAATQARLFEPFFTTKPVGQGTGLGLAMVYGIVKQSGGNIWVYSELGRGSTFKIYFPQFQGEEAASPAAGPATQWGVGNPSNATILVVEDEFAVRQAVRRLLERHGYRVLEASNGGDALVILADAPGGVDLVISDMVMPAMSGLQLEQQVRTLRPDLPVLLMSGYTEEAITRLGRSGSLPVLIEKPFTVEGMLAKVRELLAEPLAGL
ncbi:MAG TPA: PAS domain S-box protein [Gemmatimonadales bacterium]|nr:PAS domain S-box protein [Gemmatimonadales bacterium]